VLIGSAVAFSRSGGPLARGIIFPRSPNRDEGFTELAAVAVEDRVRTSTASSTEAAGPRPSVRRVMRGDGDRTRACDRPLVVALARARRRSELSTADLELPRARAPRSPSWLPLRWPPCSARSCAHEARNDTPWPALTDVTSCMSRRERRFWWDPIEWSGLPCATERGACLSNGRPSTRLSPGGARSAPRALSTLHPGELQRQHRRVCEPEVGLDGSTRRWPRWRARSLSRAHSRSSRRGHRAPDVGARTAPPNDGRAHLLIEGGERGAGRRHGDASSREPDLRGARRTVVSARGRGQERGPPRGTLSCRTSDTCIAIRRAAGSDMSTQLGPDRPPNCWRVTACFG
jgi:hypothetical protein